MSSSMPYTWTVLDLPQESVIKGDAKVLAVAAASIIAKVTRDRMMVEYAGVYPGYAFEKNKGYGTKAHYEGLREKGPFVLYTGRLFSKKDGSLQLADLYPEIL